MLFSTALPAYPDADEGYELVFEVDRTPCVVHVTLTDWREPGFVKVTRTLLMERHGYRSGPLVLRVNGAAASYPGTEGEETAAWLTAAWAAFCQAYPDVLPMLHEIAAAQQPEIMAQMHDSM